jgi:hypothetical protein
VDHDLGIGVAGELVALALELGAQFLEILDDAVVDDGHAVDEMRMRVAFGRCAMRGPARVGNADAAGQRLFAEALFQIDQLAFGATAMKLPVNDRRHARGIIPPVFKPFQGIDKPSCNRLVSNDPDNSAHKPLRSFEWF